MSERKTYGIAWCHGRDPEDGGWHFDGGDTVDGYDVAYKTADRAAAEELGVPAELLDLFEADRTPPGLDPAADAAEIYGDGYGLFGWLQDNAELFRS